MIEVKKDDDGSNLGSPDGVTIASSSSLSSSSCDNVTPRSTPLHGYITPIHVYDCGICAILSWKLSVSVT